MLPSEVSPFFLRGGTFLRRRPMGRLASVLLQCYRSLRVPIRRFRYFPSGLLALLGRVSFFRYLVRSVSSTPKCPRKVVRYATTLSSSHVRDRGPRTFSYARRMETIPSGVRQFVSRFLRGRVRFFKYCLGEHRGHRRFPRRLIFSVKLRGDDRLLLKGSASLRRFLQIIFRSFRYLGPGLPRGDVYRLKASAFSYAKEGMSWSALLYP